MTEVEIQTTDEAVALLNRCSEQRRTSETADHQRSSRSHMIFTIRMLQYVWNG